MIKQKENWGGKRFGSGAKKKEETTTTGFRIHTDSLNKCRDAYGRSLNSKVNNFIKRLAKRSLNK